MISSWSALFAPTCHAADAAAYNPTRSETDRGLYETPTG